MAESFFATLKTEFYARRIWPTKAGAKQAIGAWIGDRYNRRRSSQGVRRVWRDVACGRLWRLRASLLLGCRACPSTTYRETRASFQPVCSASISVLAGDATTCTTPVVHVVPSMQAFDLYARRAARPVAGWTPREAATLLDRTDHPRRVRDATLRPDRGRSRSRITRCPPTEVTASSLRNAAWLALAVIAFNLTRAAGALAAPDLARATTATVRRKLVHVPCRVATSARRVILHHPRDWPWETAWTRLITRVTDPPRLIGKLTIAGNGTNPTNTVEPPGGEAGRSPTPCAPRTPATPLNRVMPNRSVDPGLVILTRNAALSDAPKFRSTTEDHPLLELFDKGTLDVLPRRTSGPLVRLVSRGPGLLPLLKLGFRDVGVHASFEEVHANPIAGLDKGQAPTSSRLWRDVEDRWGSRGSRLPAVPETRECLDPFADQPLRRPHVDYFP